MIVKVAGSSFRESKQVSIAAPLAEVLGIERSGSATVNLAKTEQYVAEHVEIAFKDQNVQRGDMWRLGLLIPDNTPVYPSKFVRSLTVAACEWDPSQGHANQGQRKRSGVGPHH